MVEENANDAVPRRNVLRATGGLLAGATMLTAQSTATAEESLQFEVTEMDEELTTADVLFPDPLFTDDEFPDGLYLGCRHHFDVEETEEGTVVTLKEEHADEGVATPVEADFDNPHQATLYFRTGDIDFSEVEGEEVTMILAYFPDGLFSPTDVFDTDTREFTPGSGAA